MAVRYKQKLTTPISDFVVVVVVAVVVLLLLLDPPFIFIIFLLVIVVYIYYQLSMTGTLNDIPVCIVIV